MAPLPLLLFLPPLLFLRPRTLRKRQRRRHPAARTRLCRSPAAVQPLLRKRAITAQRKMEQKKTAPAQTLWLLPKGQPQRVTARSAAA